ncbi:MAG TPA: hypothetical protein VJM82_00745 [Nitrospiraceae bacterium]|nr:hypothetical protein [Nitrospiraceae bacterium]
MNLRAALIFLVLGFIALLLVMGAASFVRWLKIAYPRSFRAILVVLCLVVVGAGVWTYMEAKERPVFHAGDLMTLEEPVVARVIPADRHSPATSCIVEIYEHLSVVDVQSGTLKARVESNNRSGPSFCSIGAQVQIELAWLHRFTLTHR